LLRSFSFFAAPHDWLMAFFRSFAVSLLLLLLLLLPLLP
jgi:hypothetical protein